MKRARRLLIVLGVVALTAGIVVTAGKRYLASKHAAAKVAAHLEAVYGGPVHVEEVDVGFGSSSLKGLRLSESGPDAPEKPWATFDEVDADVSVWDLIRGEAQPQHLTLKGAAVALRFDKAGRLLTHLPAREGRGGALPEIRLEGSRITLSQEGRPDLVIHGVNATLHKGSEQETLEGTVADPKWGDWTLSGTLDPTRRGGSITLKTEHIHLTQPMLDSLPFVSPVVWKAVRIEKGDTPVEFTLGSRADEENFHYEITLNPQSTTVEVTSIDLKAEQARGRVVIKDGLVELRDVQGQAAGGDIATSGDLNFRTTPDRLDLGVRVKQVILKQLPKSWKIPEQIDGRLTGEAKLAVMIGKDKVHTDGTGEGVVTEARFIGFPADPMHLRLHADADGFHFKLREPVAEQEAARFVPAVALLLIAPAPAAERGLIDRAATLPAQAVNLLHEGVRLATNAVSDTGRRLLRALPQASDKPPDPRKPPTYLEANLSLRDVDLKQLLAGLKVEAPLNIEGRISFQVQAAFPVDTPGDMKAYRLRGTATLPWMTLEGLRLEDVRARISYQEGVLRLEELHGRVPEETPGKTAPTAAGSFDGTAQVQVALFGNLTARLDLENIPLARVLSLVPGAAEWAGGAFSGNVSVQAPLFRLRQPAAWTAAGKISSKRVRAYGLNLEDAAGDIRMKAGLLTLSDVKGRLEGAPVSGSAELRLTDPYRYEAKLALGRTLLTDLQRLAPQLRPPVAITGRFEATADLKGTLNPLTAITSGTGTASEVKVATVKLATLKFDWENNADRLALTNVRAGLYGGEVTGSATVPLRDTVAGKMDLRFKDVELGDLGKDVPALPVRVEGKANGTIDGTLPVVAAGREREATAKLDLQAPKLRVQGLPAERLRGSVAYRKGKVDYRFEGDTLGGKFNLNGTLPADPKPAEPPPDGRLQIEGAQLGRVWETFGVQALRPLRGRVDLNVDFRHDGPDGAATGEGRFALTRLRWDTTELTERIGGSVRLARQELRFRDLTGTLGGGLLRSQVSINLRQPERSWFTLDLDRVEASRLLAPWPSLAARVQGPVEARLRGTLGREWRGSGLINLSRGRVLDVDVNDWRLPVDFAFAPSQGRGQVEIHDTHAQVALGRVLGSGTAGWGLGSRVDVHLRFFGVDLRTLLRQFSDSSQLGGGQMTGRVDLTGNDVRSAEDLTGTMDATLQQTQAMEFPVLRQLTPFLMPGQSNGGTFRSGDVRARLARGVVRVERLSLAGTFLQLLVEGTVSLEGGRLNLEATANTGQVGVNPAFLRLLGLRIPAVGPVPLTLVLQASSYLANRVIHLGVTGTVRNPVVRVEPVSLLTEEAVRFFLNRSNVPVP